MNLTNDKTNSDLLLLEDFSRFRRTLNLYFTNGLKTLGLGVKQASLLRNLAKRGKASLAELSRDTMTDPAAMTRLVNDMIKNGIVRQQDHPTDKRRWELALTPQGKTLALEVEKIFVVQAEETLVVLSTAEKKFFSQTLQKLTQHLSDKKSAANAGKIKKQRKRK